MYCDPNRPVTSRGLGRVEPRLIGTYGEAELGLEWRGKSEL